VTGTAPSESAIHTASLGAPLLADPLVSSCGGSSLMSCPSLGEGGINTLAGATTACCVCFCERGGRSWRWSALAGAAAQLAAKFEFSREK